MLNDFHKIPNNIDDNTCGINENEHLTQQNCNADQNQSNQQCSCDNCKNYYRFVCFIIIM